MEYDTFVRDPVDFPVEQETELLVRVLDPEDPRMKYKYSRVKVVLSPDTEKYSNSLKVRLLKGELCPDKWSMEILESRPLF